MKTTYNVRPQVTDFDNEFKNYWFYDFEVFAEDVFLVMMRYDKREVKVLHNSDFAKERDWLINQVHENIMVGYNNYHYDDYILQSILNENTDRLYSEDNKTPLFVHSTKYLNDTIINGGTVSIPMKDIISLDCMQQMHVSLKKIEANIGRNIKETDIPFNINRKLNDVEQKLVVEYCKTDVDATIDVFKLRWKSYFEPKLKIIELLKENKVRALRWNTTTITANILTQDNKYRLKEWWDIRLSPDDNGSHEFLAKFDKQGVVNMWENQETGKRTVSDFGVNFDFGFGGLHGVPSVDINKYSNVKLLDVASMYPNILINLNALGTSTKTYKNIVEERIRVKESDPTLSTALKLIINSTYGLLKNKYSAIFNPKAATSICIVGQVALYKLCQMLNDAGYKIINVNTDGVAFIDNRNDGKWKKVKREWEKEFNLTLELDEFKKWIQKDVNNYMAETKNGKIKVKGKDLKHFNDKTDFTGELIDSFPGEAWNNTNSLQIVTKCLVEYIRNGKQPNITIMENLDKPIMFQMVLQAGKTFKGLIDQNGNRDYQKVNRVFACKADHKDRVTLYKERQDGGKNSFADAPEHMFLWNESLEDLNLKDKLDMLDINFYVEKAWNVINRWETEVL